MNYITTSHNHILELLEDIVKLSHLNATELIICSTKEDFLEQVLSEIDHYNADIRTTTSSHQEDDGNRPREQTSSSPSHILLSRTLQLLSASQHVNLIFCTTITVLRGYLSGFVSKPSPMSPSSSSPSSGQITILNLLAMHHSTSEFTLQGLS